MRQLQNDREKIGSFYQNHRSNIPPDSAFTYGLINSGAAGSAARGYQGKVGHTRNETRSSFPKASNCSPSSL